MNDSIIARWLVEIAKRTEGETRALVELLSCRLGFGHVSALDIPATSPVAGVSGEKENTMRTSEDVVGRDRKAKRIAEIRERFCRNNPNECAEMSQADCDIHYLLYLLAQPSADRDGWIAGFNAGIDAVIAARNDWNYFPVDLSRIAKLKRHAAPVAKEGRES
jgi:hypothetical protein